MSRENSEPEDNRTSSDAGDTSTSSETPKPETPKPETPKPETPKPETPKPETPKPETPKPETPKPETPKPETPKPETPKPETPKPETPKPETPKPETPKPETPKPETPKPETPKPETPKPETPKPETPKPEKIQSIAQFFAYAYSRGGKVFSFSPVVIRALVGDATELEILSEEVARLSASDVLLSVPPRVLSAIDRAAIRGDLRTTLLHLAIIPFLRHPGFSAAPEISGGVAGVPTVDHEALMRSVRRLLSSISAENLGRPDLAPAARGGLITNAIATLALYLAMKERWSSNALAECLDSHLWQHQLAEMKGGSQRALLVDNPAPAALGLVAKVWQARVSEQARQVREAYEEVGSALTARKDALEKVEGLVAEKGEVDATLTLREREISQLQEELAAERDHRRVEKSHAVNDYESLRTQMVRGLDRHAVLLEDGLHALKNGSANVTEEYLERVIDSVRGDLARLRSGELKTRGF